MLWRNTSDSSIRSPLDPFFARQRLCPHLVREWAVRTANGCSVGLGQMAQAIEGEAVGLLAAEVGERAEFNGRIRGFNDKVWKVRREVRAQS